MWWHTVTQGRGIEGKLANEVGSQYPWHYLGTWCIQHYYRWCAHLCCQQSTERTPPVDLNGLVRFAERRNLVSARVPSRFNWPLASTIAGCEIRCKLRNKRKANSVSLQETDGQTEYPFVKITVFWDVTPFRCQVLNYTAWNRKT